MSVYDIKSVDVCSLDQKAFFLLDANILYWLFAGYVLSPTDKDYLKAYNFSNFVGSLLVNGNPLGTSIGNVQEVLNLIERIEYRLYKNSGGSLQRKKDFRKDPTQRSLVQKKIQAAYNAICETCTLFELSLDKLGLDQFISDMPCHLYDPIDFFVAKDLVRNGYANYITSDPDFQCDSRLNIFTIL